MTAAVAAAYLAAGFLAGLWFATAVTYGRRLGEHLAARRANR